MKRPVPPPLKLVAEDDEDLIKSDPDAIAQNNAAGETPASLSKILDRDGRDSGAFSGEQDPRRDHPVVEVRSSEELGINRLLERCYTPAVRVEGRASIITPWSGACVCEIRDWVGYRRRRHARAGIESVYLIARKSVTKSLLEP